VAILRTKFPSFAPESPMDIEKFAYWFTFAIPLLLMALGCTTQKLIEGKPWSRKHFYAGLDLTIYFLAACLINVADLAKEPPHDPSRYIWTSGLIAIAVVVLFLQTAVHQAWERDNKRRIGQIVVLCIASNGAGLFLLYCFVRMKLEGYL
jgi:uncharacterized membrane protein